MNNRVSYLDLIKPLIFFTIINNKFYICKEISKTKPKGSIEVQYEYTITLRMVVFGFPLITTGKYEAKFHHRT